MRAIINELTEYFTRLPILKASLKFSRYLKLPGNKLGVKNSVPGINPSGVENSVNVLNKIGGAAFVNVPQLGSQPQPQPQVQSQVLPQPQPQSQIQSPPQQPPSADNNTNPAPVNNNQNVQQAPA